MVMFVNIFGELWGSLERGRYCYWPLKIKAKDIAMYSIKHRLLLLLPPLATTTTQIACPRNQWYKG